MTTKIALIFFPLTSSIKSDNNNAWAYPKRLRTTQPISALSQEVPLSHRTGRQFSFSFSLRFLPLVILVSLGKQNLLRENKKPNFFFLPAFFLRSFLSLALWHLLHIGLFPTHMLS